MFFEFAVIELLGHYFDLSMFIFWGIPAIIYSYTYKPKPNNIELLEQLHVKLDFILAKIK